MSRLKLQIEGMTCAHCEQSSAYALTAAGAKQTEVDWRRGEAVLDFAGDPERLTSAVKEVGYVPGVVEFLEVPTTVPRAAGGGDYDLVAIGAGSAAFAAAIRATNLGARVAIVERNTVGGTCVNVGCIPSKNLLAASENFHRAGHHPFAGVSTKQVGVDMSVLVGMKNDIVGELRQAKYEDLADHYGFEIIRGDARFIGPDTIDVDGREIRAGHFVIATGSAPSVAPLDGLEEAGYLTSTTAMELKELAESLIVVGGGYVGLEMGQIFRHLGVKVTIIASGEVLAPREEPEISQWITRVFRDEGFEVVTSARAIRVEGGEHKTVIANVDGSEQAFRAEEILMATGRKPVLEGLDLGKAGVEVNNDGRMKLDDELRTTNPRVFAAGDVTGAPQFVYVAAAHGTLVADNAIKDARRKMDYKALPHVIFTSPNIAGVGMTEAEALQAGFECDCRTLELKDVPRPIVNVDTRGGFKIVADKSTGKVLGVHAVAENAGDVMLAAVYAVKFGLTVEDLADTWAPYLTMAEGLKLTAQTFTTDVSMLSCCAA
ncbi:MAG: mercury(II) reductase [Actinomycetota bacterium]|nr:mercury(II) reductase [Actinomycetota bacterium]